MEASVDSLIIDKEILVVRIDSLSNAKAILEASTDSLFVEVDDFNREMSDIMIDMHESLNNKALNEIAAESDGCGDFITLLAMLADLFEEGGD